VGLKPHIGGTFIKDNSHYLTIVKSTHGADSLPPNISTSQFESATKVDDADDRQGNKVINDHDQKSDPTIDEDTTHQRIAVGENYEPKVDIVKEVVKEYKHLTNNNEQSMMDGEHHGEHDDQPLVKLLGDMIKTNNAEKNDPHNTDTGPGAVDDQRGLCDHAEPEDHHQEDRLSYMHKPKDKTDFGDT
jgi:hypothetical protein